MRVTLNTPEALVIDDFLGEEELQLVWNYIQAEEFEHAHNEGWVNAWRLTDGQPLRGPVCLSHQSQVESISPVFPSGRGVDLLIKQVMNISQGLEPWTGKHGIDWSYFFTRPYLYGPNSGLSWHRDQNHGSTAAFTFYCHPHWNVAWGGELLVAENKTKDLAFPPKPLYGEESPRFLGSHFDNSAENEALLEEGIGRYILPRPNRLVLVGAGVLHAIKKVDPAIGTAVRSTLQGVFMRPELNGEELR